MFGSQLISGTCGCGCSTGACNQQKYMTAQVGGGGCAGLANAVSWINANFSSVSPLTLAWATHAAGWQYAWEGSFDTPSDTTPDPADTFTSAGIVGGSGEYPNSSIYAYASGEGVATRIAFLLPDSTVQIVGTWCSDADCVIVQQQACTMTGVPTGCGYVFDIPIPASSLCNATYPIPGAEYTVWPNSTYGGLFEDYLWSAFLTACAANPTTCASGCLTPGACLSGDPFFGDDP